MPSDSWTMVSLFVVVEITVPSTDSLISVIRDSPRQGKVLNYYLFYVYVFLCIDYGPCTVAEELAN